ncbi:hypothetical protein ACFLTC_01460 [Chloroflexota bacterium]
MSDMRYARTHDQVHRGELDTSDSLYAAIRAQGERWRFWSSLRGRPCALYALVEIDATCTVQAHRHTGLKTVPIRRILGSESRSSDFDRDFHPLQDHNKGRWLRIARARQRGAALPPVDLIRVGGVYFVRDGHHRISVARSLGQLDIEAKVVVWQVDGPLRWETQVTKPSLTGQEMVMKRLFEGTWHGSARLLDRVLLNLRQLGIATRTRLGAKAPVQAATGR